MMFQLFNPRNSQQCFNLGLMKPLRLLQPREGVNFFLKTHKIFLIFKTFLTFSSDKDMLQKEIETLNTQIINLDTKCDELTLARSGLTKDMSSLKLDYTDQIRQYARQMDDSVSVKHNLEQVVIAHLRKATQKNIGKNPLLYIMISS